ncbi:MAG: hypothetical protein WC421_01140 [Elusimicrobiales bacterium]
MGKPRLPEKFITLCRKITAKRPKTVIEHILRHGFITTEQLKNKYGYNHPPRAARDVKEQGVPLEMFRVKGTGGRKIAAYRFGDPAQARFGKFSGRTALTKKLKRLLLQKQGAKCAIYLEKFEERNLQIDHRIPYDIAGDDVSGTGNPDDFMLLCSSANRAKSWSCEHCVNRTGNKDIKVCRECYWAFPENYTHIAMLKMRRLDIMWTGSETAVYDKLKEKAEQVRQDMPDYVKKIIERNL